MAIPWQSIFAPLCVRFLLLVVVDAYKKGNLMGGSVELERIPGFLQNVLQSVMTVL